MAGSSLQKPLLLLGIFFGLWLGVTYLLPILFPFLLGAGVALAADPAVRFAQRKLKLPRPWASGLGVTVTLILLTALLSIVGALLIKELGNLAHAVPDLEQTAQKGTVLVQDFLVGMAQRAPEGIRPVLTRTALQLFDDSSAVIEQVTRRIPGMVSSVLGRVPDSALGLGTGLIAAYLISARLPRIRKAVSDRLPERFHQRYLPALRRARKALGGWLRAQGRLALMTYGIVAVGFLLLRVPYGLGWAILVALVDAVPMLGTGLILVPWALVSFLQREPVRAIGLLCIFVVAACARAVLEPRLVGRQLGLDPLLTLLALYLGYRLWGIPGMLIAPILATAAKSLAEPGTE